MQLLALLLLALDDLPHLQRVRRVLRQREALSARTP